MPDKNYHQLDMWGRVIVLTVLLLAVSAVPIEDEVHLNDSIYTNHRWFSGYLNITNGSFHYVLFESQRDPNNDPVVLWLNGGPGCSSLIGMVYENGPFVFPPNETSFVLNDYAWNKKANLLYITSPQGVGFSVGQPGILDDGTVATYNLKALLQFYVKFPNLKNNALYMTGESYAGIYIPYLANEVIKHNKLPSSKDTQINLKGVMIGNACTDPTQCYQPKNGLSIHQYEYLYKHTYFSDHQYQEFKSTCLLNYDSEQCSTLRTQLQNDFNKYKTSLLNIYNPCYVQNLTKTSYVHQNGRIEEVDEDHCEDSIGMDEWFNDPLIQEQLHVEFMHFDDCSKDVAKSYVMFANASYWLYPIMMQEGLRVWVYSGDADADVPITGTMRWLNKLRNEQGLPVKEPWREWWVPGKHKHEDQVGGMVWSLKGLTFASVRGAGHEVPRDKKQASYTLIDSFLNGAPLPYKDTTQV